MKDQWLDWLQEKQRHFFYGITIVVASLFIAFQTFGKFYKPKQNRFWVTYNAFEKGMLQGEAFEKLKRALRDNPELETKFGAQIADAFIAQNEGEKAQPFADKVLQRVKQQTPEHAEYAEGSLLISKRDFTNALSKAITLKDKLDHESLLYGFNLIRIASLYRVLETPDKEVAALQELENYMQKNQKASAVLMECFHEGELSLQDYITHRKETLYPKE